MYRHSQVILVCVRWSTKFVLEESNVREIVMAAATQMLLLLLPSNESLSVFVPREQHFEEEPNGGLLEGKTEFTQLYNITNRFE